AEFAPGQRSQLRIVANTVAADAFLPELLADFLVLHPYTDIALEELPSPAIAQAIAERAADIGIVADHADLRGLASYPFRQDRLVLALPPGHALSGRRQLSFADALPFDFIGLPEQSALQQHLEQLAIRSGGPMRLRARAANFDAICRMVLRGAGLAVVPEESARRLPEILRNALPLTDDWAIRCLSIVVRERAQLPLPAQRLVAFLRQEEDGITGAR
ncbi:LysR substrate-binding domain-containing protein, partial [Serratia marcescens]|uniref:LysR substrate-binding domain-containing protein n=5 Tax=Serratia TaxID=613 RepID=UPI001BD502FE